MSVHTKADVTRFVPLSPGQAGPLFFADSDGTVDVDFTDRDGMPWFRYRVREGKYTVPVHPRATTVNGKLIHPYGQFAYGNLERAIGPEMRGTGILTPPQLEPSPFLDFRPWYSYVIEEDILAGRRGVAGWDGYSYDRGLWLPPLSPAEDWTIIKVAGGVVMIVGGVIACFIPGGQGPGIGLIIGGAGLLMSGYAEASMHNPNAPWAVGYTAARVTDIVGMTLFAFGTVKATAPLIPLLPRLLQRALLAGAGYAVADTGIDIIRNWDKMNALDIAQRTVPLVAAFAGAMAYGGYRLAKGGNHPSWRQWRIAERAIASRTMTRAEWKAYSRSLRITKNDLVQVTRWGRLGLQPGDWVMKGGRTRLNYILSGKFQPDWMPGHNIPAAFRSGQSFYVPRSAVQWPRGWGIDGWLKGLLRQRIYLP